MLFLFAETFGSSAWSTTSDNLDDLLLLDGCTVVEASAVDTPEMLDCCEAVAEVVGLIRPDVLVVVLEVGVVFSADFPPLLFVDLLDTFETFVAGYVWSRVASGSRVGSM